MCDRSVPTPLLSLPIWKSYFTFVSSISFSNSLAVPTPPTTRRSFLVFSSGRTRPTMSMFSMATVSLSGNAGFSQ